MRLILTIILVLGPISTFGSAKFNWRLIATGQKKSVGEKVIEFSQYFKGESYGASPLGEGLAAYDQDPLYRFDSFDCTTFIETVLALARSNSKKQFIQHLNRLRYYDGKVGFEFRKHFISLDWLKDNEKLGYIKDVNAEIFPKHLIKFATVRISRKNWYEMSHPQMLDAFNQTDLLPTQKAITPYLPVEAFFKISPKDTEIIKGLSKNLLKLEKRSMKLKTTANESKGDMYLDIQSAVTQLKKLAPPNPKIMNAIPSPAIVTFIRPNWYLKHKIGTNLNVSHQGLTYRKNGQVWLRHASTFHGKIIDERFEAYLLRRLNHRLMKGLHISAIVEASN